MSQPDLPRQIRQQRSDIDALYDLSVRMDEKIDAVGARVIAVDARVAAVDAKVDALGERLGRRFDDLNGQLATILRHLDNG